MVKTTAYRADLKAELDRALDLLSDYRAASGQGQLAPLSSLLEECETLCAEVAAENATVFRSLHHFACSGGTLISKCVGALPNTVLLSEIDPLSTLHFRKQLIRPFYPTDVVSDLYFNPRISDTSIQKDVFLAGISKMQETLNGRGLNLVLRDHAHSQFCFNVDPEARATLYEILQPAGQVHGAVTLRHPLDSYLSLAANKWRHFEPFTLDEYCRRYDLFLDRYVGLPWIKYESFLDRPEDVLAEIAVALKLPFNAAALDAAMVMKLSGDSGRGGTKISRRPRREIPEHIQQEAEQSERFAPLCGRMGYEV